MIDVRDVAREANMKQGTEDRMDDLRVAMVSDDWTPLEPLLAFLGIRIAPRDDLDRPCSPTTRHVSRTPTRWAIAASLAFRHPGTPAVMNSNASSS